MIFLSMNCSPSCCVSLSLAQPTPNYREGIKRKINATSSRFSQSCLSTSFDFKLCNARQTDCTRWSKILVNSDCRVPNCEKNWSKLLSTGHTPKSSLVSSAHMDTAFVLLRTSLPVWHRWEHQAGDYNGFARYRRQSLLTLTLQSTSCSSQGTSSQRNS